MMKWVDRMLDDVFNDMGLKIVPFESRARPEQNHNPAAEAEAEAETKALMRRLTLKL